VRGIPVAGKAEMIEKLSHHQCCLFRRVDYRKRIYTTEKISSHYHPLSLLSLSSAFIPSWYCMLLMQPPILNLSKLTPVVDAADWFSKLSIKQSEIQNSAVYLKPPLFP
jgi:hypothetical protein